jgi:hypothetical protein
VQVHTPLTTRAKELMHLYRGLQLPLLSVEERLDVLLHVKWTVKEFDCNLTRELVDLARPRTLAMFNCVNLLRCVRLLRRALNFPGTPLWWGPARALACAAHLRKPQQA